MGQVFTIKPVWETISVIRGLIREALEDKRVSQELLDSTDIVCMELLENAVKFGVSTPDCSEVVLNTDFSNAQLTLVISNGVLSRDNAGYLLDILDKVASGGDVEAMYVDRLNEIAENPKSGRSQLGILRIMYETGFQLTYKLEGQKLTLTAQRKIA